MFALASFTGACTTVEGEDFTENSPASDDVGTAEQAVLSSPQLLPFNGAGRDSASVAYVDTAGSTYVGGFVDDPTASGTASIFKYDSAGNLEYRLGQGAGNNTAIHVDPYLNVYTAREHSPSSGTVDTVVTKMGSFLSPSWEMRLPGSGTPRQVLWEETRSVFGQVFVASNDVFSMQVFDGSLAWRSPAQNAPFTATGMVFDAHSNVVVTGTSAGNVQTTKYAFENGSILWRRTFTRDASSDDRSRALAIDSEGNVYVTGASFASGAAVGSPFVLSYDAGGNVRWSSIDPTVGGASISVDSTNDVVVGQDLQSGTSPFRVTKLTPAGARLWQTALPTGVGARRSAVNRAGEIFLADGLETTQLSAAGAVTGRYTSDAVAADLLVDVFGNVVVTGTVQPSGTNPNILTLRFLLGTGTPPPPFPVPTPTPTPEPGPPVATPTNLTATAARRGVVNLRWTDRSSDETGFEIQRCQGSNCTNFGVIAELGPNVSSYSDAARRSTLYRYRVQAAQIPGTSSAFSNVASVRTSSF